MRAVVVAGTRPEFLKLAPVVAALRARGNDVEAVRSGQHVDPAMTPGQLSRGQNAVTTWTLAGSDAERSGALLNAALAHLGARAATTDVVLVQGDTSTAALVGLAARRHGLPVAHVEAGLRSNNERSLEEVHRRMLAAIATVHLAPTSGAAANLHAEGVPLHRIHVVGNPICDALAAMGIARMHPAERRGVLFTAHRATNVDDPERLARIVDTAVGLATVIGPVRFPVHPRTWQRLEAAGHLRTLQNAPVTLDPPLEHRELLEALASAQVVVTDSGGLQEEASWYGVPCVVLRHSTPRPEGVEAGQAVLAGLDADRALRAALRLIRPEESARIAAQPCPYGDGRTGERIATVLHDLQAADALRLVEPQLSVEVTS